MSEEQLHDDGVAVAAGERVRTPSGRGAPPALVAARRRGGRRPVRDAVRPYPAVLVSDDAESASVQLAATRALLTAATPEDVVAVVAALVRDLGGGLVPARLAHADSAMHLDVSFGLSEPVLAWADPVSVASMRLSRDLPGFVSDARTVFDRLQADARRAEEAERDPLTGLLTRRAWMRRLSNADAGDSVCVMELHHLAPAREPRQALRAADRALHRVKASGRGATAVATAADDEALGPP